MGCRASSTLPVVLASLLTKPRLRFANASSFFKIKSFWSFLPVHSHLFSQFGLRISSLKTVRFARRARQSFPMSCYPTENSSPAAYLFPRQRIEIDIAADENNADAFSADVDLALHDPSVRNGC